MITSSTSRAASAAAFASAAVSAIVLWKTLPVMRGVHEVWDDISAHSVAWLAITGFALGLILPRHLRAAICGCFFGQLAYLVAPFADATLHPLALPLYVALTAWVSLMLFAWTMVAALGAVAGATIRLLIRGAEGRDELRRAFADAFAWWERMEKMR